MDDKEDSSTITDAVFVEQCDYVKQYYDHILTSEEKSLLEQILTMEVSERRLLYAMSFYIFSLKYRYIRKRVYFYASKCYVNIAYRQQVQLSHQFYN